MAGKFDKINTKGDGVSEGLDGQSHSKGKRATGDVLPYHDSAGDSVDKALSKYSQMEEKEEHEPENRIQATIVKLEGLVIDNSGKRNAEAMTLLSQVKRLERGLNDGSLNIDVLSKLVVDDKTISKSKVKRGDVRYINPLEDPVAFLRGVAKLGSKVGIIGFKNKFPDREFIASIMLKNEEIKNALAASGTVGKDMSPGLSEAEGNAVFGYLSSVEAPKQKEQKTA